MMTEPYVLFSIVSWRIFLQVGRPECVVEAPPRPIPGNPIPL